MEKKKIEKKVSEKKQKTLSDLVDLIRKNRTVMIASIENIPSVQFQRIKKALKGKIILKVIKKNLVLKAIEKDKIPGIQELEKKLEKNFAIIFSSLDVFEVASLLSNSKLKSKIKPGQIAEKEIIIETGATDIMAGPAISDFTKVNIKVGIEQGKIAVKEPFIIKVGTKITLDLAAVLDKLEIKPLGLSLKPIIAYDAHDKKVYENINIDVEAAISSLGLASREAHNLAIKISYACKETIAQLLSKANMEFMALNTKLNLDQTQTEAPKEAPVSVESPTSAPAS